MRIEFLVSIVALLAICSSEVEAAPAREVNLGLGKQVAISYLGGFGGAMMGGMMGGLTYWITATEKQKREDKHSWFPSSVVYFFAGVALGYPTGSATLLHLNDRSSSFPWMMAGALGTELGVTGFVALAAHYDHPTLAKVSLWGYLLVPLGGVIAFNRTRGRALRYGDAILEIRNGGLNLCFPKIIVKPKTVQRLGLDLIRLKF